VQLKDYERQKNQLQQSLAFPGTGRSEAPESSRQGTESSMGKHMPESPASSEQLREEICQAENCKQALARVKANKGSPGIDGMTVGKLPDYL
jgi:RNA-directed DNA polymerase